MFAFSKLMHNLQLDESYGNDDEESDGAAQQVDSQRSAEENLRFLVIGHARIFRMDAASGSGGRVVARGLNNNIAIHVHYKIINRYEFLKRR